MREEESQQNIGEVRDKGEIYMHTCTRTSTCIHAHVHMHTCTEKRDVSHTRPQNLTYLVKYV